MSNQSDIQDSLSSLVHAAGTLLASSITGRALSFIAYILLARVLQPEVFGQMMYAYVIVNTAAQVVMFGIPEGIARQLSSTSSQVDVVRAGYIVVGPIAVVAAIAVFLLRFEIATFVDDPSIVVPLALLSSVLFLQPLSNVVIAVLRGFELSRETALIRDIIPQIVGLSLFGGLVLLGQEYLGGLLYWVVLPLTSLGAALVPVHRQIGLRTVVFGMPSREEFLDLISFSWPLALQTAFVVVMTNIDVIAIGYFHTSTEVGYYKSIVPVAQLSLLLLYSYLFLYLPIATEHHSNRDISGISRLYMFSTKWLTLGTFPFVLLLALFPGSIIRVLFSNAYLPAKNALAILAGGMFLRVLVGPNAATIKAIGRTKIDLISSICGLLANIVLNLLLVPRFGMAGAAVATAIGFALYNFVELTVLYWFAGIQPFSRHLFKPAFITGVFGFIVARLVSARRLGFIELALIGGLLLGFELISIYLTQSFEADDVIIIDQIEKQIGVDLKYVKQLLSG